MSIRWIGAHAGNYRKGRAGYRPEAIVIHIMEGSLAGTDAWFNDPASQVSAHYGIGRDGETHHYVQEPDSAFHAGVVDRPSWSLLKPGINPNLYTVGIEHEGRGGDPWPWPAAQLTASHDLVIAVAQRWSIPLDAEHVITHHAIRFAKSCPGVHFDHADYIRGLQARAAGHPAGASGLPVRVRARARVRKAPSTTAPILRMLPAGAMFLARDSVTDGEAVEGNAVWHRNPNGEFLWAGATDRPHAV